MAVGLGTDCWDGVVEGAEGGVFAFEHGGVGADFDEEVSGGCVSVNVFWAEVVVMGLISLVSLAKWKG